MKKLVITAIALAAMSSAAAAQGYRGHANHAGDRIDQRQAKQQQRIQHGLRTGALTRYEARELRAQQAYIRQLERLAKRDGHVSQHEARRIEKAQNAASRHIFQEKHDAQRRSSFWRKPGLWQRRWW